MNEVKIQIPNNCELIKDGNTYIVREKKQGPPRSWKEFCERYPTKKGEAYINGRGEIISMCMDHSSRKDKNFQTSIEEAEAFLALMQLRQLRKAWIGDWEPTYDAGYFYVIGNRLSNEVDVISASGHTSALTFPTKEMAEDFLNCFRDLCETAKSLI